MFKGWRIINRNWKSSFSLKPRAILSGCWVWAWNLENESGTLVLQVHADKEQVSSQLNIVQRTFEISERVEGKYCWSGHFGLFLGRPGRPQWPATVFEQRSVVCDISIVCQKSSGNGWHLKWRTIKFSKSVRFPWRYLETGVYYEENSQSTWPDCM